MSGIFHSLKKTLVKGDARPDLEFIEAKSRFEQYSETCLKLKGNIANYLTHVTAMYVSSSQIAMDLNTLLTDPETRDANEYTECVTSLRQEHQTLAQEQVPKLQHVFSTTLLNAVDEECARNNELAKRVTRRIELFSELGYYQKKVNELREERAVRAGKGKQESTADHEKFERNQKKLDEVQLTFSEANSRLMADLERQWTQDRVKHMGPIMQNFLKQERKIAEAYGQGLLQVKGGSA